MRARLLVALTSGVIVAACHPGGRGVEQPAPATEPEGTVERTTPGDRDAARRTEDLLVGRFPGVRVIELPGGGFAVRVWGPATVSGSQEPLYVVDGFPVEVSPSRGLDWLSPGDIESIRVLKDVGDTAPWGVRGANGVVEITTRHHRSGGSG